jgi:hypothetical protein
MTIRFLAASPGGPAGRYLLNPGGYAEQLARLLLSALARYGTHAVTVCRRPEPIPQTSATRCTPRPAGAEPRWSVDRGFGAA